MEAKAELKYLRIAPRKVRLVAELVRNKKISKVIPELKFSGKKAAKNLDFELAAVLRDEIEVMKKRV